MISQSSMQAQSATPFKLDWPDGSSLGLHVGRSAERQRRQRVLLPAAAQAWDYAPLIDVVRWEEGFDTPQFTGKTVADWRRDLQKAKSAQLPRFVQWFEGLSARLMRSLDKWPRRPINRYPVDWGRLPFTSHLAHQLAATGLRKASVGQWLGTVHSLLKKGVKAEEMAESGLLVRLQRASATRTLTLEQVLNHIRLDHVTPRIVSESRLGFATKAGWREVCERIPAREFAKRGLWGSAMTDTRYVIRYRHIALAWSVVQCRHRDLFTAQSSWWCVLNEQGLRIDQPEAGFVEPHEAMAFAEQQINRRYASGGHDQAVTAWSDYALSGGDAYKEILIQLNDWPHAYKSRHFQTRNVLVHLRTSLRFTDSGRRILYLDEVQSDWHAALRAAQQAENLVVGSGIFDGNGPAIGSLDLPPTVALAPMAKEWPLLALKLMLWHAQQTGADGLAWSTAELQAQRWRGYQPPLWLYEQQLPKEAANLAKALGLTLETTCMSARRGGRTVESGPKGWLVLNGFGVPVTKPFRTQAQAERMADLTDTFVRLEVPVLWIDGLPPLQSIPLYGSGPGQLWFSKPKDDGSAQGPVASNRKAPVTQGGRTSTRAHTNTRSRCKESNAHGN